MAVEFVARVTKGKAESPRSATRFFPKSARDMGVFQSSSAMSHALMNARSRASKTMINCFCIQKHYVHISLLCFLRQWSNSYSTVFVERQQEHI